MKISFLIASKNYLHTKVAKIFNEIDDIHIICDIRTITEKKEKKNSHY